VTIEKPTYHAQGCTNPDCGGCGVLFDGEVSYSTSKPVRIDMNDYSPTPGQWEVYRCRSAEPDQACGIRVAGTADVQNGIDFGSVATMIVSDTARDDCQHHMRLVDATHICWLHNQAITPSYVMKGDATPEQIAKLRESTSWKAPPKILDSEDVKRTVAIIEADRAATPLNAAEVVYGLLAWLTCRDEVTTLSARHDASVAADLAAQFCKTNKLGDVSSSWPGNLIHPPSKAQSRLSITHVAAMPDGTFQVGGTREYDVPALWPKGIGTAVPTSALGADMPVGLMSPTVENFDLEVRNVRQLAVALWAIECFGEAEASSVPQRALRLAEEAIEAAQAADVDERLVHDLVKYVYGRPVGDISQEIAGVGITLLALAASVGVSADVVEREEFERVLSKPRDFFTKRNALKNTAGFLVVK